MKIIFTFLLIVGIAPISFGQSSNQEIAIQVLRKVNLLRDSLHLSKLSLDNVLNEAGEDHAYYMAQSGELSHFQKTYSKETPSERVLYYHGNRTYVGENVAQVNASWRQKKVLNSEKVADGLFRGWVNSPGHYKNMINPYYTKMGIGHWLSKEKVFAAQVFSSNEIHLPRAFKKSDVSWGVRPGEVTCKDDDQVYETMFFANSVEVDGRDIYMYFHDLEFFKHVIENENDGLAIDVVLREQLPCNKENQFHISRVYDGEMQRPIYKHDIFRNNISSNPKKIRVKIGEVPAYLGNRQWAANIIIINDNILCDYSVPTEVPSDIYPLLEIKPYYEIDHSTTYQPKRIHVQESMHVELYYERSRGKFSALDGFEFDKLLKWGSFAKNIKVNCFASVEGKKWLNLQLLEDRKNDVQTLLMNNFIGLDRVDFSIAENWESMTRQILAHDLKELRGKDEIGIKYFFKKNRSQFYDSLLFEQRKTHIYAEVDTTIQVNSFMDYRFASSFDSTVDFDDLPWNKVLYEEFIDPEFPLDEELFDSLYSHVNYRTNILSAGAIEYANVGFDSTKVEKFLKEVDVKNPEQVFNYAHFITRYWYGKFAHSSELKGVAKTISPETLRKMLLEINSPKIEQENLTRLRVNILLAGIHYYVTYDDWSLVNSYFDKIVELVKSDYFDANEGRELALFCNYFHKFKQSIAILDPFYDRKELDEEGLFVLAKTATLWRDKLDQDRYHAYMQSAKEINHKRYCKWLDTEFQIQRDEYLKRDFCTECR